MDGGDLPIYLDTGWSRMHYGFFEPIWSFILLPLFFMTTVVWDFARFLVESPDLQDSAKKRKEISKRLRRKQTRSGKR
jgi:hypothetical protein